MLPLFTQAEGRKGGRQPAPNQKASPRRTKRGGKAPPPEKQQKSSSSARPHGGGIYLPNSVVTGAGRFGTSRLELNVESNFRCDQVGRSLKSRSSDQLCAPSVKLYVGLSSLSEIFLASRGMKFVISSVPPDMRFSRSRISALRGQPAFPACLCHLGHMVIGVALADSISAS